MEIILNDTSTKDLVEKLSELEYEEFMLLDRLEELKKERQKYEEEIITRGNFK